MDVPRVKQRWVLAASGAGAGAIQPGPGVLRQGRQVQGMGQRRRVPQQCRLYESKLPGLLRLVQYVGTLSSSTNQTPVQGRQFALPGLGSARRVPEEPKLHVRPLQTLLRQVLSSLVCPNVAHLTVPHSGS